MTPEFKKGVAYKKLSMWITEHSSYYYSNLFPPIVLFFTPFRVKQKKTNLIVSVTRRRDIKIPLYLFFSVRKNLI